MDDEWTGDDATDMPCDRCGILRPCIFTNNPFTAEIHPDEPNPDEWWCLTCHRSYADDI